MSRIGKKPIIIPENAEVSVDNGEVSVKGPLGEIKRLFGDKIKIAIEDSAVVLSLKNDDLSSKALWGTYASHINNMVIGTTKGFEKKLIIEGVGFKVQLEGDKLVLGLGFSHPVNVDIPKGIKAQTEKNTITISGIDKEQVGDFTAKIRALKKPEPYKGKGIRYDSEVVRRKAGKKAATTAG